MANGDRRTGGAAGTVDAVRVHAFEYPTDGPDGVEQDGTLEWDSTTVVLVEIDGGGHTGIGYTYGDVSVAALAESKVAPALLGADPLAPPAAWHHVFGRIRNAGRPGVGAMAVSAADIALWDLKAKLLDLPMFQVLPAFHDRVPVYGSGGFTNYPLPRLADQLTGWAQQGIPRVKLKTSRDPSADPARLTAVRQAVGPDTELFTDANGALSRKEALYWSRRFADEWDVRWFEEPVTSDDPAGLRMLRDHGPGRLEIAAGEYGYVLRDFAALLEAGAVDCLQADVTRCGGLTGLLQVAGAAAAAHVDLSAHCAPAVSAHAFCAVQRLRHLEYFHDHVRIERMLFDGTLSPRGGELCPDPGRPGLGLRVKWADAEAHRVHGPERA
ncbi:enolase C-terminal domain-like protein [Streptantibioticus cattleyicolor]|uniref:Racemase n=1 Tax=Streptantibioticus cattleyicolor (strain ATCC 35852 / DSM 46488 / JCM 4925 / NBRC 14057 / NRRL 8057) TaxID=1003195 RepID=F8JLB6_STREN|nr:enolase C-terminal domain-like protein [Streptantibioticus cattleyicolor]AEW99598.1 racemase [Streptantibioticus cattleyicolor NRRL 8057 = DSM 46488]CCB71365.1 putative racemase [Streptantibioticus cattleyicolor NRRL 8057 = DSM 46488]